jgi:transcriptional regulator with XRE-family HTH domain
MVAVPVRESFGDRLRDWRRRRHLSQLELAVSADVSARHLSFLETGRSRPSREMVLHLAEELEVPLRERNSMLVAAGFAPLYPERTLEEPDMRNVRAALDLVLAGHEPYPALVVDRWWNMVAANAAVGLFVELLDDELLAPPINVYRASLHPRGLAPHVTNLAEYAAHLIGRLRRQVALSGDPTLAALLEEVRGYPGATDHVVELDTASRVVMPVRLRHPEGELTMFSTITVFGTPVDVTLDELAIEAMYPGDEHTADVLRARAGARSA